MPRTRLQLSIALACFALLTGCPQTPPDDAAPADPPDWAAQFALPEAEDRNPDPQIVEIDLEAKLAMRELRPGVMTEVWSYNGLLPGPVIRARRGDRVIVHFTNRLPEATTIHWHGLRVPAPMDGTESTQTPIEPGSSFTYDFVVPDSGTFWYHPHVRSSHQVNDGLYGAFIVEDPDAPDLGAELLMVLSDVLLDPDGSLSSPTAGGHLGDYFGREGNVLLVNGRVRPTLTMRTGRAQHWRIINASRARYQWFSVPGARVVRVGGDGGLIETPVAVDRLLLVPGERAELMVIPEATPGSAHTVEWLPHERGYHTSVRPNEPLFDLAYSDLPAVKPPSIPTRLAEILEVPTGAARSMLIELTEENVSGKMELGINGTPSWEAAPIDVQAHEIHVWEVRNATDADHPFHLHGFFFQVLSVDGAPPPVREWKDTVNIPAKKSVRIVIPFDHREGMWMFHCHILDHADLGMMGMVHLHGHSHGP